MQLQKKNETAQTVKGQRAEEMDGWKMQQTMELNSAGTKVPIEGKTSKRHVRNRKGNELV